jgi:uncharacterized protein (TIGR00255 family)
MQNEFSLSGEPDLNVIARLPNALQPKKEELSEEFALAVKVSLNNALDELEKMRLAEGDALKTELFFRLSEIENHLPRIEAESANVAEEFRVRLTKKLNDFLAKSETQIEIDQARLAQEVAYLADRSDISEEIMRLRSHIEHFRNISEDEKDTGKQLDFLTQELNREANTIASKTNNLAVKEAALVQNVE